MLKTKVIDKRSEQSILHERELLTKLKSKYDYLHNNSIII